MTVRHTAYAKPLPLALLTPARPWQSWKRSSDGKVERWPRSTRALLIAVGWRTARCTSSRERAMNKHYPHLADKLPAPSEKVGNIKILILRWWAREDSNLQPSGYEPLALTIELRARCLHATGLSRERQLNIVDPLVKVAGGRADAT